MSIGRIASHTVVIGAPGESILEITHRMEDHNVGTVVIVSDRGCPLGIVTDRDVAIRCVAHGHVPRDTPVSAIMTRDVRTIDESTPVEEALGKMARVGKRRLVVTGAEGRVVGVVALDDVINLLIDEVDHILMVLRKEAPAGHAEALT